MTHEEIQEKLHDLHDQELNPVHAAEMAVHLEACPECASTLDKIKRISGALFSYPASPSSEDFVQRVMARIEQEEPVAAPWGVLWRLPTFGLGFAAAAFLFMANVGGDPSSIEELLLADNRGSAPPESMLLATESIDSDDILGASLEE